MKEVAYGPVARRSTPGRTAFSEGSPPMELTALEFARLLHDLKCDVKPGDRRVNPRAPTRVRAYVIPITPDTAMPVKQPVWIRDVSRGGFGVTSQTQYEEGSRLLVLMPKSTIDMFVVLCEICRSTRMPGNTYTMGARLMRRVTPDEYAHLLAGTGEMMKSLSVAQAA